MTTEEGVRRVQEILARMGRPRFQDCSGLLHSLPRFSAAIKPDRLVFDDGAGIPQAFRRLHGIELESIVIERSKWLFATHSYSIPYPVWSGGDLIAEIIKGRCECLLAIARLVEEMLPLDFDSEKGDFIVGLKGDWLRESVNIMAQQPNCIIVYVDLTWQPIIRKRLD